MTKKHAETQIEGIKLVRAAIKVIAIVFVIILFLGLMGW